MAQRYNSSHARRGRQEAANEVRRICWLERKLASSAFINSGSVLIEDDGSLNCVFHRAPSFPPGLGVSFESLMMGGGNGHPFRQRWPQFPDTAVCYSGDIQTLKMHTRASTISVHSLFLSLGLDSRPYKFPVLFCFSTS